MSVTRTMFATAATMSLAGSLVPAGVAGAVELSGIELLRNAADDRGVGAGDEEFAALDAQLGGRDAVQSFLDRSATEIDDHTTVVAEHGIPSPSARAIEGPMAAASSSCYSRRDRFSRQVGGVEFQHFTMHTDWCSDGSSGSVTSVSAYRVSYGTTLAGQLQGYRWTAAPSVQEQRRFVGYTATDKNGTTTLYKGRTRMSGHYEICLTGPVGWLCPTSGDSHTETTVGYGSSSTSRSYNA